MTIFCLYCGTIIPELEKLKRRHMYRGKCQRFVHMYICMCCGKGFNYHKLINHKVLFKNTLKMLLHQ